MNRERMYNGWAKDKIFVYATERVREDSCIVEAEYNGTQYTYTTYKKDMVGSANMCNIAFNGLWNALLKLNKNIELRWKEL